jgi:hypothetical protein
MSTASTATLEPKTELEGSGARKASALRVLRMLQTAIGPTIAGLLRVLTTGSGASRDFGPAKTSWRIEDPQAAKQKCLISSRFPSLTRVPLSASAAERRLLSADAPEPSQESPLGFLSNYRGYIQADAFPGYDRLYANLHIQEIACWAHCRRK